MRRGMLELCLIIVVVIGIHAERLLHNGSIEGRISPANPSSVIAVRGNDSIKIKSDDGHFGMELRPGDWKLIFAAKEYNGVAPTEKKVQVFEGRRIDLGEIRLDQ
jgi:hypothetical protein